MLGEISISSPNHVCYNIHKDKLKQFTNEFMKKCQETDELEVIKLFAGKDLNGLKRLRRVINTEIKRQEDCGG